MIRFALQCDNGHAFEGWFRDNATYDAQVQAGLVECTHCGSKQVAKAIMAPSVARTDRERAPAVMPAAPDQGSVPMASVSQGPLSPELKAMRDMLRALRAHVEATADNVGDRFADEARKMHYGDIEHRAIYGQATLEEVRELKDEGVEAFPMPLLPDDRN